MGATLINKQGISKKMKTKSKTLKLHNGGDNLILSKIVTYIHINPSRMSGRTKLILF